MRGEINTMSRTAIRVHPRMDPADIVFISDARPTECPVIRPVGMDGRMDVDRPDGTDADRC